MTGLPPRIGPFRTIRSIDGGLAGLMAVEVVGGLIGFAVSVCWARRLGTDGFATLETATVTAGWLLVLVRSGVDAIATREVARCPRLARPFADLALGLRLAGAALGMALAIGLGLVWGGPLGILIPLATLTLVPSALALDVVLRAQNRLGAIAFGSLVRLGWLAVVGWLWVGDPIRAIVVGILAESAGALVVGTAHVAAFGFPRPRLPLRAVGVVLRLGLTAGITRLLRVGLYGIDLLVLAWMLGPTDTGPYAAARRIVFGLIAVGLVVPTVVLPRIARAAREGPSAVRRIVFEIGWPLTGLSMIGALALALTSHELLPIVFGASYRGSGAGMFWLAARIPALLLATLLQAALIACRKESEALGVVGRQTLLAALTYPPTAIWFGVEGVALAALGCETFGALVGWRALDRDGERQG